MTNEEKIKEIVENQPFVFFTDNYQAMIAWGADKMAEWKDQQFKEYLEKKKAYYHQICVESIGLNETLWGAKEDTIELIIHELFPKEETDCSDNDE